MKLERQLAWPCHDCTVRGSNFCSSIIDKSFSEPASKKNNIAQVFLSGDKLEVLPPNGPNGGGHFAGPMVLCEGWAYRFHRFSDGRRQILSVLIPGDLFSVSALVDAQSEFSVQAVTDIKICQLGRDDIKRELAATPAVCETFGMLCAVEMDEKASTLIGLNEHDHVTRILGFVQRLIKRLAARGIMIAPDVYPFPMSYTDIADATGLTPDDVTQVFDALREDRMIDMFDNGLSILNPIEFEKHTMARAH